MSRTNYTIEILGDISIAEQFIKKYLSSNDFYLTVKNGEIFYISREATKGIKGFRYYFKGQTLNISVCIITSFGKEVKLSMDSRNKKINDYNKSLKTLFQSLSDIASKT